VGPGAGAPGSGKKNGRGKERKKRQKRKREKEIEKEIGEGRKRRENGFRKLGEILGKIEGRGKRDVVGFSDFSGVSVIFGTAVMARQTVRRDRDMRRIPGVVADSGAGAARGGRQWPEC
jgi:hypothetical protein